MIDFLTDFAAVVWALRTWIAIAAFVMLTACWAEEVAHRKHAERVADRLREENYQLRHRLHSLGQLPPRPRHRRPILTFDRRVSR